MAFPIGTDASEHGSAPVITVVVQTPPAEVRKFLPGETEKWALVAQRGGIKPE